MKYIPNYTVSKWRFYHWNVSHSRRPLSHDDSFQPLFVTAWFYGPIENVCPPVLRGHLTLCCDHWYTVKIIFKWPLPTKPNTSCAVLQAEQWWRSFTHVEECLPFKTKKEEETEETSLLLLDWKFDSVICHMKLCGTKYWWQNVLMR